MLEADARRARAARRCRRTRLRAVAGRSSCATRSASATSRSASAGSRTISTERRVAEGRLELSRVAADALAGLVAARREELVEGAGQPQQAPRPRRDQRLPRQRAAERGEGGGELGADLERRERRRPRRRRFERALDHAGEGRRRLAGAALDDPAVDHLERPHGRCVELAVADARCEPAHLDPRGEAADRRVALVHDGGERADHPGARPQPRGEVGVRRLLPLPGELVPGGPELLELLGGPRDLDPDAGAVTLDGLNTKPTCAPRCRGSPPTDGGIVFGIATSTRTGRVLDRDRDHARGCRSPRRWWISV